MNTRLILLCLAAAVFAGVGYIVLQPKGAQKQASSAVPTPAAAAPSAAAPAVPTQQGEILLTIIAGPDAAGQPLAFTYDLAALKALPATRIETTTMWTDGIQRFDGVDLKALLTQLNITTGKVIATAINDYRIEIPIAEIEPGAPIIAYAMNDAPMPMRDKGPLWIVYPYDSNAKHQSEVVFSRSIWQLIRLEIEP